MSIITSYPQEAIQAHLKAFYGLEGYECLKTDRGLDNTVLLLRKPDREIEYVLKIVETKSLSQIEASIELSGSFKASFCPLEYLPNCEGRVVFINPQFGKPCFIYRYLAGTPLVISTNEGALRLGGFIRGFHGSREQSSATVREYFNGEMEQIKTYFHPDVRRGLLKDAPEHLRLCEQVYHFIKANEDSLYADASLFPLTMGLIHGDPSPDNLLQDPSGDFALIDCDGISSHGLQLFDLVQLVCKSSLLENADLLESFWDGYFGKVDANYSRGIKPWVLLSSLKMVLSTHYYTYVIPKLTPEWVSLNAQPVLSKLERAMRSQMQ